MIKECEDRIDLSEYDLRAISIEQLKALLSVVSCCEDCYGCDGDKKQLEKIIEERMVQ